MRGRNPVRQPAHPSPFDVYEIYPEISYHRSTKLTDDMGPLSSNHAWPRSDAPSSTSRVASTQMRTEDYILATPHDSVSQSGRKLLCRLDDPGLSMDDVGGKAIDLARVTEDGFRVPPAFVVTVDVYRSFIETGLRSLHEPIEKVDYTDAVDIRHWEPVVGSPR